MASLNKQQKRAQRAKVKAKQQRVARSVRPAFAPDDAPFDPDYFPYGFDDNVLDDQDLLDDVDDLFGPEEEALLFDMMSEHFEELKKAESISQFEMLLAFLRGPLALAALADEAVDTETAASGLAVMLARYWEWADGIDLAHSLKRMEEPDFVNDFTKAFQIVEQETAELLAAEPDLLDPPE